MDKYRPGETVEQSGNYEIVDEDGSNTGIERTVERGETFPPTPKSGQLYQMSNSSSSNKNQRN